MADCFPYFNSHLRILDPGSGTGILSAAVCEAAFRRETVKRLHIDAYELHPALATLTSLVLAFSRAWLHQRGVTLTFEVIQDDFVLFYTSQFRSTSMTSGSLDKPDGQVTRYDLVIANPPYFKIGETYKRAVTGTRVAHGQPNIYTLFMAISAELLSEAGRLVYIVPRSFTSGPYFKSFRETFFRRVTPTAIHLFGSRKEVFKNQTVLQENLVITAQRRRLDDTLGSGQVVLSHSEGVNDLACRQVLSVGMEAVLNPTSIHQELSIPVCPEDLELAKTIRLWPNTLQSLGLDISTGPVVPFRATEYLERSGFGPSAVPLLWMHHVHPMHVAWPLTIGAKPQWIKRTGKSTNLLVSDNTYVLLRRFSAKEEKRRLIAAPLIRGSLNSTSLGLENHLNYIRGVERPLDVELAYGLAALLNTTYMDRFFRLSNGNTQVSATELRVMPLPLECDIRDLGRQATGQADFAQDLPTLDRQVASLLGLDGIDNEGVGPQ